MQERWNDDTSVAARLRQIRDSERSFKATKMIVLHTAAFYLCWIPFAIKSILAITGLNTPPILSIMAIFCAQSGAVVNPIVYIWCNSQVKYFAMLFYMLVKNLLTCIYFVIVLEIQRKSILN